MSFPLVTPPKDPNIKTVKDAANIFRAYNHGLRQQILTLLRNQEQGMNVTDIFTKLRIEQSVASLQLKTLKEAYLVYAIRDGKNMNYFYNKSNILKMQKIAKDLVDSLQPFHHKKNN